MRPAAGRVPWLISGWIPRSLPTSRPSSSKRDLGHDGVFALLRLWAYVADCRYGADRVLSADDVELAVDWDGEPGALVAAFAGIGFLDAVDGGYLIHDWDEHNGGFAATAGQRSAAARNAAAIRWRERVLTGCRHGCGRRARKNGKTPAPMPAWMRARMRKLMRIMRPQCPRMQEAMPHLHIHLHIHLQYKRKSIVRQGGRCAWLTAGDSAWWRWWDETCSCRKA